MLQLQSNGRCKSYAYIKSSVHVFNEIIKPNGAEFHGNKLILEEAIKHHLKQFTATITLNEGSNSLEPLPNIPPSKPANPTRSNADQPLIQNAKNSYSDAIYAQ